MKKALLAASLLLAGMVSACSEQSGSDPAIDMESFMLNEVQTTALVYWNSVRYEADLEGERDYVPEADEEWAKVEQAAAHLEEIGQTLKTPSYAEGRGKDWLQYAQGLSDVAAIAKKAAVEQDADAVLDVGGTLYNVCQACHQVYLPEETELDVDPAANEG